MGCAAQTVYLLGVEPQAALDHATPLYTALGDTVKKVVEFAAESIGAFPLHGTVRFGTARYGTVRLSSGRFAFPPQFSTAIEWAGLFTRRYNCATSS